MNGLLPYRVENSNIYGKEITHLFLRNLFNLQHHEHLVFDTVIQEILIKLMEKKTQHVFLSCCGDHSAGLCLFAVNVVETGLLGHS
jgi:hypothetical protein